MIADRDVDMVTAAVSSVHAVMRNKRVMVLWGLVLVMLTVIGFATALLGLGLLMPWLAYASWHGYRETLDASAWAALEWPRGKVGPGGAGVHRHDHGERG
jgi:uncharacterized membrane protein